MNDNRELLKKAFFEAKCSEFSHIPEKTDIEPSAKLDRRIKRLAKEEKGVFFKLLNTTGKRVAAAVIVIAAVLSLSMTVNAIREPFVKAITEFVTDEKTDGTDTDALPDESEFESESAEETFAESEQTALTTEADSTEEAPMQEVQSAEEEEIFVPEEKDSPETSADTDESIKWEYDGASRTLSVVGSGKIPDMSEEEAESRKESEMINAERIIIDERITEIGEYAFFGFSNVTEEVSLPRNLKVVGSEAFGEVGGFGETVYFPDTIEYIGENVFCDSVKCVSFPARIPLNHFDYEVEFDVRGEDDFPNGTLPDYFSVDISGSFESGVEWFYDKSRRMLVLIGEGEVPDFDFEEYDWGIDIRKAVSVTIDNRITSIGDNAFRFFDHVSRISPLSPALRYIGDNAFTGIRALKEVTFSEGLEEIGQYAFSNTGIVELTVPKSVRKIEKGAFGYCDIEKLTFEGGSVKIYDKAFYDCENLREVVFPEMRIEKLGSYVFGNCKKLEKIDMSLVTVSGSGPRVFCGCESLIQAHLPEGFDDMLGTFDECKKLESVYVPSSVRSMTYNSFGSCESLKAVVFAGSAEDFENIPKSRNDAFPAAEILIFGK